MTDIAALSELLRGPSGRAGPAFLSRGRKGVRVTVELRDGDIVGLAGLVVVVAVLELVVVEG